MAGNQSSVFKSIRHYISRFFKLIFSLTLAALLCPIVILLWLLNELVRRLIIYPLLRIVYHGKVKLVPDGADNVWSFNKNGNSRNILILTVYSDVIDPEKYRTNFMTRVINYVAKNGKQPYWKLKEIYTQNFGYHCWEKPEKAFDINDHIKVVNTLEEIQKGTPNSPGSQNHNSFQLELHHPTSGLPIVTESDVLKMLGHLTPDMEDCRPQWEEIIIPRFVYDNEVEHQFLTDESKSKLKLGLKTDYKIRSARIFRCHHAYMDGASYLLMTSNCMADGEFPYVADPLAASRMSKSRQVYHLISCIAFSVTTILKTIIVAATARNRFVTRKFKGTAHHTWSDPIDLDTLLEIRRTTKSSIPTILASVTAGAIRKLDERYPPPNKNKSKTTNKSISKTNKNEKGCSILCWKRPSSSSPSLPPSTSFSSFNEPATLGDKDDSCCTPDKVLIGMIGAVCPYPDVSPRNRYTVVNFYTSTETTTRLQRLKRTQEIMIKLGENQDFLVNLWMFQFFGKFPNFFIQAMMKNGGSPVVVSNTPWARSKVKLMGDEVEELGGWIPLLTFSGVGLLITRYCETVRFCAVAEDACLSEEQLRFLVGEIQTEIYMLAQECVSAQNPLMVPAALSASTRV